MPTSPPLHDRASRARRTLAGVLAVGALAACDDRTSIPAPRSPDGSIDADGSAAELDGRVAADAAPSADDGGTSIDAGIPPMSRLQVVAGGSHTCVRAETTARCWGLNEVGQLGNGSYGSAADVLAPGAVAIDFGAGLAPTALAVGVDHSCARLDDGTLECWGDNAYSQLGYGNNRVFPAPGAPDTRFEPYFGESTVRFPGSLGVAEVALGARHSCARLDDATVRCWGDNTDGQLGTGDRASLGRPALAPARVGGRGVARVFVGGRGSCALFVDGSVACWGANDAGQLGVGDMQDRAEAAVVELGPGRTARELALGGTHSCALLDDGTLECWGANASGQLGYGDTTPRARPAAVAIALGPGRTARAVVAGGEFTCAILDDGSVRCWGRNTDGALGYGDTVDRAAPAAQPVDLGGRSARSIAAGRGHVCVVLDDDSVRCWGNNSAGQLGVGDRMSRALPASVAL